MVPRSSAGMMKPLGAAGRSEFSTSSIRQVFCSSVRSTGPSPVGNPPGSASATAATSGAGKQESMSRPMRSCMPLSLWGLSIVPLSIAAVIRSRARSGRPSAPAIRLRMHSCWVASNSTGPSSGMPPAGAEASATSSSGTSGRFGLTLVPSPNWMNRRATKASPGRTASPATSVTSPARRRTSTSNTVMRLLSSTANISPAGLTASAGTTKAPFTVGSGKL